ncbi:hypothetical protein Tcan_01784, partial [Toxocara canis]
NQVHVSPLQEFESLAAAARRSIHPVPTSTPQCHVRWRLHAPRNLVSSFVLFQVAHEGRQSSTQATSSSAYVPAHAALELAPAGKKPLVSRASNVASDPPILVSALHFLLALDHRCLFPVVQPKPLITHSITISVTPSNELTSSLILILSQKHRNL